MIRPAVLLFLSATAFPNTAWADAGPSRAVPAADLKVTGSLRVRHEILGGQPRTGLPTDDEQIAVRTTLTAEYRKQGLRLGGEIYDSRVYASPPGGALSANEANALELVQAYVGADLGAVLGTGSSAQLQAGRMTLNLGSRRLVAADDYRNTTNGYTGIRADLKARDGTAATFIYTLPQIRLPDDPQGLRERRVQWDRESFDLQLWGGLVGRPRTLAGAMAEVGYFRLQETDSPGRPTRNRQLHSISARIIRDPKPGRLDFEAETIFQFGTVRTGLAVSAPQVTVDARFLHLDLGYSFPGKARVRVSLEYDYASGDGPGQNYGRFDTLFGMRRADLAPAGIYNAIGRANIRTPAVRVEAAPGKRFDAFAVYRAMWLADRTDSFSTTGVRDATGQSGSFAGHQVEARLRYWLVPNRLRGELNGVWLAKGRFLREAPNAPQTGNTRYLATSLTASF